MLAHIQKAIARGVYIQFSAFTPGNYHVRFLSRRSNMPVAHWYPRRQTLWLGRTPIRQIPGDYPTVDSVLDALRKEAEKQHAEACNRMVALHHA
jgi:hypothetical protein